MIIADSWLNITEKRFHVLSRKTHLGPLVELRLRLQYICHFWLTIDLKFGGECIWSGHGQPAWTCSLRDKSTTQRKLLPGTSSVTENPQGMLLRLLPVCKGLLGPWVHLPYTLYQTFQSTLARNHIQICLVEKTNGIHGAWRLSETVCTVTHLRNPAANMTTNVFMMRCVLSALVLDQSSCQLLFLTWLLFLIYFSISLWLMKTDIVCFQLSNSFFFIFVNTSPYLSIW